MPVHEELYFQHYLSASPILGVYRSNAVLVDIASAIFRKVLIPQEEVCRKFDDSYRCLSVFVPHH